MCPIILVQAFSLSNYLPPPSYCSCDLYALSSLNIEALKLCVSEILSEKWFVLRSQRMAISNEQTIYTGFKTISNTLKKKKNSKQISMKNFIVIYSIII